MSENATSKQPTVTEQLNAIFAEFAQEAEERERKAKVYRDKSRARIDAILEKRAQQRRQMEANKTMEERIEAIMNSPILPDEPPPPPTIEQEIARGESFIERVSDAMFKPTHRIDEKGRPLQGDFDDPEEMVFVDENNGWIEPAPNTPRQFNAVQPIIEPPKRTEPQDPDAEDPDLWHADQNRSQRLRRSKNGTRYSPKDMPELYASSRKFTYDLVVLDPTTVVRMEMNVKKVIWAPTRKHADHNLLELFGRRNWEIVRENKITEEDAKEETFQPKAQRVKRLYNNADSYISSGPYHVFRTLADGAEQHEESFGNPELVTDFIAIDRNPESLTIRFNDRPVRWTAQSWIRGRRIQQVIAGVGEEEYSRDQYGRWEGSRFIKPRNMMIGWDTEGGVDYKPEPMPVVEAPKYSNVEALLHAIQTGADTSEIVQRIKEEAQCAS